MRIVFLADRATAARRGSALVLLDASDLARRGHEVTVLSELPPPADLELACTHVVLEHLGPDAVPDADLVVAGSRSTADLAMAANAGPIAELESPPPSEPGRAPSWVAAATHGRLPPGARTGRHVLPAAIDPSVFHSAPAPRTRGAEVRIGAWGAGIRQVSALCTELADLGIAALAVAVDVPESTDGGVPPTRSAHELAGVMRSLDVFVAPAEHDVAGVAQIVLEAMACGIPCVLADVPVLRERIGNRRGAALLIEADDPRGLIESVGLVLRHRGLREQLAQAGLEIVASHARDRRVDELERALALIAARADRPAAFPHGWTRSAPDAAAPVDLVHALAQRAESHVLDGRLQDAVSCLEAALAIVPDSVLLWTQLGGTRLRTGDPAGAIAALDKATEEGGTSCRLHEMRADALRALARPQDAAQALGSAARCEDATAATFRALADALRAQGDVPGARAALEEAAVRAAVG